MNLLQSLRDIVYFLEHERPYAAATAKAEITAKAMLAHLESGEHIESRGDLWGVVGCLRRDIDQVRRHYQIVVEQRELMRKERDELKATIAHDAPIAADLKRQLADVIASNDRLQRWCVQLETQQDWFGHVVGERDEARAEVEHLKARLAECQAEKHPEFIPVPYAVPMPVSQPYLPNPPQPFTHPYYRPHNSVQIICEPGWSICGTLGGALHHQ